MVLLDSFVFMFVVPVIVAPLVLFIHIEVTFLPILLSRS